VLTDSVVVTFEPRRGYVATLPDGSSVSALSLAGLKQRLPNARLVLDRKARFERDQRRKGGHGGAAQWRGQ
jgi:hypothetical protein